MLVDVILGVKFTTTLGNDDALLVTTKSKTVVAGEGIRGW